MLRSIKTIVTFGAMVAALAACEPNQAMMAGMSPEDAAKAQAAARLNAPQANAAIYAATQDGEFVVPAVPVEKVPAQLQRQVVDYPTNDAPGTVIIDPANKSLHLITGRNRAIRYGIAVGKAGFEWSGEATITDRKHWPMWTPPKEMIERKPELAKWEKGQPGGPTNPLGARALYLTTNGVDYGYRIHGTPEWNSIGRNASSGCIRMINQDVMDLYSRVPDGAKVVVLNRDGSRPTRLKLPPPAPKKVAKPVEQLPVEAEAPAVVQNATPGFPPMTPPASGPALGGMVMPMVPPALVSPGPALAPVAIQPAPEATAAPTATPAPACAVPLVNGICPPATP